MHKNVKAFLDTLAWAEGTDRPEIQDSQFGGYDVAVGGSLFLDFRSHPRKVHKIKSGNRFIYSSAHGRYQFLDRTWTALAKRLRLTDFGPRAQDAACIELLRECGALPYIERGEFVHAVKAACRIWASLPGAGYNQLEQKMDTLRLVYLQKGGKVT